MTLKHSSSIMFFFFLWSVALMDFLCIVCICGDFTLAYYQMQYFTVRIYLKSSLTYTTVSVQLICSVIIIVY